MPIRGERKGGFRSGEEWGRRLPSPHSPLLLLFRDSPLRLLLANHPSNVSEEFLRVVDDSVLNHVSDATDTLDLTGLVVQPGSAVAVQDLEVLNGILFNDCEIGEVRWPDRPDLRALAKSIVKALTSVKGRSPDLHGLVRG